MCSWKMYHQNSLLWELVHFLFFIIIIILFGFFEYFIFNFFDVNSRFETLKFRLHVHAKPTG